MTNQNERRLTVVLFEGFEVLDVFGPVELFSQIPEITIELVAEEANAVRSAQGIDVVANRSYADVDDPDILLIPGGSGTRKLAEDNCFLSWLAEVGAQAQLVTSVCTGSALLAAAGLLEGYRATSNKLAFGWVSSIGEEIEWDSNARWVEDGSRWTSSGVTAGMDMASALISKLYGQNVMDQVANFIEFQPQSDSTVDPFAK